MSIGHLLSLTRKTSPGFLRSPGPPYTPVTHESVPRVWGRQLLGGGAAPTNPLDLGFGNLGKAGMAKAVLVVLFCFLGLAGLLVGWLVCLVRLLFLVASEGVFAVNYIAGFIPAANQRERTPTRWVSAWWVARNSRSSTALAFGWLGGWRKCQTIFFVS